MSGFKNFLLTFVISLAVFGLIAVAVVGIVLDTMGISADRGDAHGDVTTYYENDTVGYEDTSTVNPELDGNSFNMLFVGLDYTPKLFYDIYNPSSVDKLPAYNSDIIAGSAAENMEYREISADAIVLMSVSKERREFAFTSFSPTTIVTMGNASVFLYEIYETYGISSLSSAVSTLTGLPIDRYAIIGMDDFAGLVDIIDGVDFNVPCDMVYDDYRGQLHINLTAGKQHLDGETALQVLRFNSYKDTDGSRMKTTVAFVKEVISKMTNPKYITKAAALFRQAEKMLVTNFSASDLSTNLDLIFSYHDFMSVTIEPPGNYTTIDDKLSFIPNANACLSTYAPYQRNSK